MDGLLKLKKLNKVIIIVAILMVLSAASAFLIPLLETHPTINIRAEKLTSQPENYFVAENADPILVQAISNLGKSVPLYSLNDTEIDNLINQHNTSNIEYDNNFYSLSFINVDYVASYQLSLLLLVSIAVFFTCVILILSIAIGLGIIKLKKRSKQQTF